MTARQLFEILTSSMIIVKLLIGLDLLLAIVELALVVWVLILHTRIPVVMWGGVFCAVRHLVHLLLLLLLIIDTRVCEVLALVFELDWDLGHSSALATLIAIISLLKLSLMVMTVWLMAPLPIAPMQVDPVGSLIIASLLCIKRASNNLCLIEEWAIGSSLSVLNEIVWGIVSSSSHASKKAFAFMTALDESCMLSWPVVMTRSSAWCRHIVQIEWYLTMRLIEATVFHVWRLGVWQIDVGVVQVVVWGRTAVLGLLAL